MGDTVGYGCGYVSAWGVGDGWMGFNKVQQAHDEQCKHRTPRTQTHTHTHPTHAMFTSMTIRKTKTVMTAEEGDSPFKLTGTNISLIKYENSRDVETALFFFNVILHCSKNRLNFLKKKGHKFS